MKRYSLLVVTFVILVAISLSFGTKSEAAKNYPGYKIAPKAGDILITSKKTTRYHSGHSAIVTDNLKVVDMPAPGSHPRILSVADWTAKYKIKNVVRLDSTTNAKKAGKWAREYQVKYKKAEYTIWSNLNTFKTNYCSKLVWQSYKYGAKYDLTQTYNQRHQKWIGTSIYMKIYPYDYTSKIKKYDHKVY